MWWCYRDAKEERYRTQDQPGLHSKFEDSLKCIVRLSQKMKGERKEKNKKGRVKEGKHGAYREH